MEEKIKITEKDKKIVAKILKAKIQGFEKDICPSGYMFRGFVINICKIEGNDKKEDIVIRFGDQIKGDLNERF